MDMVIKVDIILNREEVDIMDNLIMDIISNLVEVVDMDMVIEEEAFTRVVINLDKEELVIMQDMEELVIMVGETKNK